MAERIQAWRSFASRRSVLSGGAALLVLSGCSREKTAEPPPEPDGPPKGSLEWAVGGPWRAQDRARDPWRHPMETAAFQKRFTNDRRLYGEVELSEFGPTSGPVAPAGTADMALFMRSVHAWMAAGIAEKAFADAYAALRPGGVLGVEQHRLGPDKDQDPTAANGYVQEAFVRQLAAEAGFVFVAASEINANERDTKDHPFGVETLPPIGLTAPRGSPPDPTFDRSKYDEIGASDRMTLRFRKPE